MLTFLLIDALIVIGLIIKYRKTFFKLPASEFLTRCLVLLILFPVNLMILFKNEG